MRDARCVTQSRSRNPNQPAKNHRCWHQERSSRAMRRRLPKYQGFIDEPPGHSGETDHARLSRPDALSVERVNDGRCCLRPQEHGLLHAETGGHQIVESECARFRPRPRPPIPSQSAASPTPGRHPTRASHPPRTSQPFSTTASSPSSSPTSSAFPSFSRRVPDHRPRRRHRDGQGRAALRRAPRVLCVRRHRPPL